MNVVTPTITKHRRLDIPAEVWEFVVDIVFEGYFIVIGCCILWNGQKDIILKGRGQNLSGTRAGTIDRDFFPKKKGGEDFFSKKIRGA